MLLHHPVDPDRYVRSRHGYVDGPAEQWRILEEKIAQSKVSRGKGAGPLACHAAHLKAVTCAPGYVGVETPLGPLAMRLYDEQLVNGHDCSTVASRILRHVVFVSVFGSRAFIATHAAPWGAGYD
eukprot:6046247-Prymnesium_polylepis.1